MEPDVHTSQTIVSNNFLMNTMSMIVDQKRNSSNFLVPSTYKDKR